MIEIRNLKYWLGDIPILKDINLKIEAGDFWLIFGPNGAGKTTLFKILAGLISNYRGEIRIDSSSTRRESRKKLARKIAYLPQFDDFSLPLTVREILMAGRYPYTTLFRSYSPEDRDLIDRTAVEFGLASFLNRDINTLSGGERKKVMLASAFVQDVSVILLDEPFTFLDPRSLVNLKRMLADLNSRKRTLIVISHQIEILHSLVNKTAAMKEGRLIFSGKQRFDPALLEETYGVRFRNMTVRGREIISIDE
jgi:ABC-type cobalamin/Fe3+-siderophores transport system ATPase subunit